MHSPGLIDRDLSRNCSHDLSYTVQAIGQAPDGGQNLGTPATVHVSPVLDCTPNVAIQGVTASSSGQVNLTVVCSGGGRGGQTQSNLALQVDGVRLWTHACSFPLNGSATGSASYPVTVSGLRPGQHRITATSTTVSGTKTAGPVSVTIRSANTSRSNSATPTSTSRSNSTTPTPTG